MAKFFKPSRNQSLIETIAQLDTNLCEKYMRILNKSLNISRVSRKTVFFLILISISLTSFSSVHSILNTNDKEIEEDSLILKDDNLQIKSIANDNQIENESFNIEALYGYVSSLYQDEGIFLEADGGYATSTATYEALSILRFFGLDYYQFGSDWEETEVKIADNLGNLRDESGSGGFYLGPDPEAQIVSLEGTFGVTTSLWIMNELPLKLKPITPVLLDFVINTTFDSEDWGFHELGQDNSSIKATFQALTILDLIRQVVIIPELIDAEKTPLVNGTVLDFMANYSSNIFEFLDSFWENSYFYSNNPLQTKIEDTWYTLQSIKIIERYGDLLEKPLTKNLINYQENVLNWLRSLKKMNGPTKGGYGTSENATITETGMVYAIFQLFNATNEINKNQSDTISFIYSSQFLKRENRTYRSSEVVHLGGFGPNNLTYTDPERSKQVNIHATYYAALTLLLSGDIFNSIELTLETSHYQEIIQESPESTNKTNYIIQGKPATIEQNFQIYDYKSHGSLNLTTTVDNWNFSHPDYTESNPSFYGKSNALYIVNLEKDIEADFNWSLGTHLLINMISIRNLPVIEPQAYYCNSTLFVGYDPKIEFEFQEIKPGDNVNTTIFYQNCSVPDISAQNITDGTISAVLETPNKKNYAWFELVPINFTKGAINYIWNVSDQALLGTWRLTTTFNQSSFEISFIVQIEVIDTIILENISSIPQYHPGEDMNLNVSLTYSNGNFTPNANASVVFISNKTQTEVFNLTLKYLQSNIYTTKGNICPIRYLHGFYNVSVRLFWNSSSKLTPDSVSNASFPVISIGGIPIISEASFKTDYRDLHALDQAESNMIYYGETINFSLKIGYKYDSIIHNVTNEKIVVRGGFTNSTQPSSFIQLLQTKYSNESLFLSELINNNLPNTTFGTRFQILSEWNNSYVYLRNSLNPDKNAAYNFSLVGTFNIKDINYIATEMSDELYCYALDSTSVISISFKIFNTELNGVDIPVPNLNLYGILDIQNKGGTLNQSLPSITSATDQNGTAIYFLSISTSDLNPNNYEIMVYTWSAMKNNLFIGRLSPGFKIIRTFFPRPILQLHEALILATGLIFILLAYLNLKKFR